ncbi:MAG: putative lipid II flippase FtsW, partial [Clostridia bacterium]|nr:putative lipid II flippase FtsW [Clostridia bacterium]
MASLTAARSGIKLNRNADRKVKPPQRIEAGDMDYTFLFIVILLLFFGLVMLLSASAPSGNTIYGDSYYFFKKQVIGAAIGLIGMFVISKVNYNVYKAFAKPMMIICTILLVFVLIPGIGVKLNGSRRWLNTPFLQLQPSEFMKPVIAMYFAKLIDNGKYDLKKLGGNLPYVGWLIVVLGLMLMETHLSGAIVIAGIGITVMIAGGTPIKPILIGLLVIIPVGIIAVHAISAVRWARVTSFLDPFRDIRNQSYQVAQGLYAIGSGGFFGLGLGQSVQKYSYLPEPYNDFIFAIVCEEIGLVGAIVVILLFAALIMRAIKIAMNAPDTYSSIVALGISAHLAIQTVLNIAVATSSVPNTGVSLPFFSYGGTAILTLLMEMGVLLNISRYS